MNYRKLNIATLGYNVLNFCNFHFLSSFHKVVAIFIILNFMQILWADAIRFTPIKYFKNAANEN